MAVTTTALQRRVSDEEESGGGFSVAWIKHVLKRRRWWILIPFVVVPLIAAAVVLQLPDEYTSSAVFELIDQQVPRQYVDQMSNMSSAEVILGVTREVLSTPRLGRIVDSFGLFPKDRGELNSEQMGEKLRSQVAVVPIDRTGPRANYTAFRISYTGENPKIAQQVLSQLSSLFVEINLKERGSQAQTTTAFLKSQMEVARERMSKQEQVLLGIKLNNISENPVLNQAKIGALSDLRIQLQNATASLSRLNQQRGSAASIVASALGRLQNERNALLSNFTAKHPEVVKRDSEIAKLEAVLTALRNHTQIPAPDNITDPVLSNLLLQVESGTAEADRLTREAQTVRDEINRYQAGLIQASSPIKQHELERAQKDFDTLKQEFSDLQARYFRAQMALNLEEDHSGQNFRLVDPPSLPAVPSGPKRLKISLAAIGAGLGLGILLAFAMELRHQTFLREADVRQNYRGVLVIGLPVMSTPSELRLQRVRLVLESVTGVIMIGAVAAAQYYIFLRG